jgi:hypothetical protein
MLHTRQHKERTYTKDKQQKPFQEAEEGKLMQNFWNTFKHNGKER